MQLEIRAPKWRGIRPWRRHGLVLLVAGLVYAGVGYSYVVNDTTDSRRVALYYAEWWFPLETWGFVWIFAGILSIISSRWPPFSETWGYTVLTGQATAWSLFYVAGVIFHNSPSENMTGCAVWGLVAFLWWAISGLVNPDGKKGLSP